MTVIHRPEIFRKPLNVHVANAAPERRLREEETVSFKIAAALAVGVGAFLVLLWWVG